MKSISNFVTWCRQNKIQVIIAWPNTIWFNEYQEPKQQSFFLSLEDFYRKIGVTVLDHPQDFMYSKDLFYNTIYHLNDRGTYQRTKQTINLLKSYLNISNKSK
jgi:hypothetical protein